ncbi:ArsC family reductase [Halioglobus maricola]|uniref:ArsC family reductase n=1 Tax=Halioglobus maricola TaxID=2601894 RepID=A0A5P9NGM3_9GAMM|nr:ArsC family reductase [Halioglobus maricola]QFU74931.1 ArsC family reductase [Halioglobus maricola]
MITLYGIKNCDSVKKARKWLDAKGVDYRFHDFRVDGVSASDVANWLDALGWETVVNRRSTTWKGLSPEQRENMDRDSALAAILEEPTLVKRPLLDAGGEYHCGFKDASYQQIFNHHTL